MNETAALERAATNRAFELQAIIHEMICGEQDIWNPMSDDEFEALKDEVRRRLTDWEQPF